MKILVTGSSGFVGGRFVADYQDQYEIKTVHLRQISASDISFDGIDVVLHCAALVHQMKGAPAEEYFKINHQITVSLAEKAKQNRVKHFVFISTAHVYGVYGNMENIVKTLGPDSPCTPRDPYGQSKLAAEQELQKMQTEGFKVSIIRPPLVYGEGSKGNLRSLEKLIRKIPILPFKYNKNRRSIIYIGNLTYFIHLVIQKYASGIFLPQDEKALSIEQITLTIAKAMGKNIWLFRPPQIFLSFLKKILPHYTCRIYGSLALDSTETDLRLGYHPLFTTAVGMQRMFNSHR